MSIPEIIAHRGTPRECLENTMASFDRALAQGADGIELDVHATRDGVVVVHHDAVVRSGPADAAAEGTLAIAERAWADLQDVALKDGSRIPTLDAVLTRVGARATVYIEVKAADMETALIACLDRHASAQLAVHAFDHRIPVAVRTRRTETSIGLLSTSYPLSLADFVSAAHAHAFWQQAHLIDESLVRDAHALGLRLIAWTVNDLALARRLAAWGVDALCTDTPGLLRDTLTSSP